MNSKDRFAVAVMDAGCRSRVVGHVPFNSAPRTFSLKEKCEQGNCGSDGAASQLRGRLQLGNTLQVQAVWSRGVHRQNCKH